MRPRSTSAPSRSDTELRTTYTFWDDGDRKSVTNPRAIETRYEYDDLGRQTAMIRNYVNGTPSGPTGDDDVYLRYTWVDGLRTEYWVDFDGDGTKDTSAPKDQVTTYTYTTVKGTSAGESRIGTGHLLQKVQYPDSSGGTDVVTYAYNAQQQGIWRKDQDGNVLEADYDTSGRLLHCRATTIDADYDDAVQRITASYDGLGRRETVTQYTNATVGSGTVLDEVQYTYEGWGQISNYEQDNDSAVGVSGVDYETSYTYAKATGGRNTIRRKTMTLPSGDGYTFKYSSTDGRPDDDASRVTSIQEGIVPSPLTTLVNYEYLGAYQLVGTEYVVPEIKQERFGSTSGVYDAFDRFDRIVEDKWVKDLTTDKAIYNVDLTYDRNSNITSLDEVGVHVGFDAKYTVDNLDRLVDAQEGTLSSGSISSETRQQTWNLDQAGNWEDATLDLDGDGTYADADEYDDDRVHNEVNELLERDTNDDGTPEYTLVYDGAGNLVDDGETYKYVYDVWYRLREILDRGDDSVVAEYRYDGQRHRIAEHVDTDDDDDVDGSDVWHHFMNDERWREIAMFEGTETVPTWQWLYQAAGLGAGGSYIDEIALRDRDADDNGSLDERFWYFQNWRADVVALIDNPGDQREMVRYSSYGVPTGLPGGSVDSDGDNDSVDQSQIQTWINGAAYDVRGDIDLDGDVDSVDKAKAGSAPLSGLALGASAMTGFCNTRGYAGYQANGHTWYVRNRILLWLGRWNRRDPLGYVDGPNLVAYTEGAPLGALDPFGLTQWSSEGGGGNHDPHDGEVPACPESPPGKKTTDDGWCYSGTPGNHGGLDCYRSYGSTKAGQQCCYDGQSLVTDYGKGAGNLDLHAPCGGEVPAAHKIRGVRAPWPHPDTGRCDCGWADKLRHVWEDWLPARDCGKDAYNKMNECMKGEGCPSGSGGESKTDEEIRTCYDACKHHCPP